MASNSDVLVIGAGPTGLVLASQLASESTSKALGVQARTLELFEFVGIVGRFVLELRCD